MRAAVWILSSQIVAGNGSMHMGNPIALIDTEKTEVKRPQVFAG